MHTKRIKATLQCGRGGIEEEIEIPVLAILSVNEWWDWIQPRNSDGSLQRKQHVYLGTHIASKCHHGWLVKERSTAIEQRIDFASKNNKHFNYECGDKNGDGCCDRIFKEVRRKKSA